MPKIQKKAGKISSIAVLICVFVVKELAWVCLIPPSEGPDELAHYRYVQTLFNERRLPTMDRTLYREDFEPDGNLSDKKEDTVTVTGSLQPKPGYLINWLAQHPPLYYLVLLPVYGLMQNQNELLVIFVMRFISVIMAAATLFFIFKTMKKLLPESKIMQTAVTCAVAFLPTFSLISAMINNDNPVNLLSAILIYLLVSRNEPKKAGKKDTAAKWGIKTGIVLAMLAMTKMTTLPLFFVVLTVLMIALFKTKETVKRRSVIRSAIIVFVIPLALAGWWYARNYATFGVFFATLKDAVNMNPDIIKYFPKLLTYFPDVDPAAAMKIWPVEFFVEKNFFMEYYKSAWGSFVHVSLLTVWQTAGIFVFTAIGVLGQIKNMLTNRVFKENPLKRFLDFLASARGILFLTFIFLLAFITWKLYELSTLRGYMSVVQGRYLLAAMPALLYMLLRGWEHFVGKKWIEKTAVVLVMMFILNDAAALILAVIPVFY